ncbi:hypothetical protein LA064_004677 [Vibrio alginolyticus]|nr:hypothetical protein [Vibrio alginolyticus]
MKKAGVALIFFTSFVQADSKVDMAICAGKSAPAERLVCYDELAKKLGVEKADTKITTGTGKWRVSEEKSPIDDSVNVYLSVLANETVLSGYKKVKPSLYVRCAENKTSIFIDWGLYLGLDETRLLTRFDKEKAKTSTWSISTDNKAIFVRGSDIKYAKKLMQHEQLLTQITPYSESPVMATFDVSGLSEAIKPLRKACHW